MSLYNVSIWAGLTSIILIACYLLIKIIIRNEMKKSLPSQIKSIQELFKDKDVRVILRINNKGVVELENFAPITNPDYMG